MLKWNLDKIPILQLGDDFYDKVAPAQFPEKNLRYWNDSLKLGLEKQHFVDFHPIAGNLTEPLALRYHGHQFQQYNPDLGDGRGFLFAQLRIGSQWWDLGTKGSGQTPYSRAGDGRLTLKGAFREALATELLESLGVNTSRTLCFYETGESLIRHDEPSPTRSAVLTRFSLGHIRIGTFQRLAYFNQIENIKKLVSYCMHFYYTEKISILDPADEAALAELFFNSVVERCAELAAQVMMAGFVHGVLNTDNINISGELFDYGPYRFLPHYEPQFTAAYFDQSGLYCFGRQPASFAWALHQLGRALSLAFPKINFDLLLERFSNVFVAAIQRRFLARLNLVSRGEAENAQLLSAFFTMLSGTQVNFEQAFFDFHSKRAMSKPDRLKKYGDQSQQFVRLLEAFAVKDLKLLQHSYFDSEHPCTLLIDEIENIWKPIAEKDDWSGFYRKLEDIRSLRGIY